MGIQLLLFLTINDAKLIESNQRKIIQSIITEIYGNKYDNWFGKALKKGKARPDYDELKGTNNEDCSNFG